MNDDAIELSPSSDSNSSNLNSPINQHVAIKRKKLNDEPTTPINRKRKKCETFGDENWQIGDEKRLFY